MPSERARPRAQQRGIARCSRRRSIRPALHWCKFVKFVSQQPNSYGLKLVYQFNDELDNCGKGATLIMGLMKILHRLSELKLGVRSTVLLLVTVFSTLVLFEVKAASPGTAISGATTNITTAAPNVSTSAIPAGVTEILKLLNANVDRETIKAYIHNSFTYWNLSADSIIRLKDLGVPSDVIAAMLERNVQLRDEAIRAAQANANAGTYGTNMATASPMYDTGQYAPTYAYPTDYANAYGYPYSYPVDYYGWYGWPVWGGGFMFFDSFGHCHFNHYNFHNGFHNGFHNSFHNGFKDFHGQSGAFHARFNNGAGFNRANLQAVNGFPGTSPQVGTALGVNHNPANLQANNGFPGTSLPVTRSFPMGANRMLRSSAAMTRTGFGGGHVMSVPQFGGHQAFNVAGGGNFAGSMRSAPRMGGVSMGRAGGTGGGMGMGGMAGGGGRGFGR